MMPVKDIFTDISETITRITQDYCTMTSIIVQCRHKTLLYSAEQIQVVQAVDLPLADNLNNSV